VKTLCLETLTHRRERRSLKEWLELLELCTAARVSDGRCEAIAQGGGLRELSGLRGGLL
jgi:hypothetical protein